MKHEVFSDKDRTRVREAIKKSVTNKQLVEIKLQCDRELAKKRGTAPAGSVETITARDVTPEQVAKAVGGEDPPETVTEEELLF